MLSSFIKLSITTFIYSLLYNPIESFLNKNYLFKKYPDSRKKYIIKNLIKSFSMFLIFINFSILYFRNGFNNILTNNLIRNFGALYVGNDLCGLIKVKNLPKTTKIHHIITLFLYSLVSYYDVEKYKIVKMISIYTIFSFIPFAVNSYLGLRFLIKKETKNKNQIILNNIIEINRILAKYVYLITCLINWIIHIQYFSNELFKLSFNILDLIYFLFLIPIINDDIILLKWLNKKYV